MNALPLSDNGGMMQTAIKNNLHYLPLKIRLCIGLSTGLGYPNQIANHKRNI